MTIRILQGDCIEVMKTLPDSSVDAVVTDPPYGIRFMGKAWDGEDIDRTHGLSSPDGRSRARTGTAAAAGKYDLAPAAMLAFQEFSRAWAAEALRVLKPGGHLLSFASTRTYHRMVAGIEDAGFEIRDQIGWVFGSGFPKSLDVSKAIDKRKDWAALKAFQEKVRAARIAVGISQSEAARRIGLIGPDETLGGGGFMWFETGMRLPNAVQYAALKGVLGMDDECDGAFESAEREIVGEHRATAGGQNMRHGIGGGDEPLPPGQVTAATSELGQKWEGWGTALKPAWEPVVVARKPLIGTVAANVLEYSTGALNIDGCRVGWPDDKPPEIGTPGWGGPAKKLTAAPGQEGDTVERSAPSQLGRWPANLAHDGSPEVLEAFPEAPGQLATASTSTRKDQNTYGAMVRGSGGAEARDDSGSAARFFNECRWDPLDPFEADAAARIYYTAKASRSDRNEGLEDPGPQFRQGRMPHDAADVEKQRRGNHHPTVKPTALMRHLCRLVTPPRRNRA